MKEQDNKSPNGEDKKSKETQLTEFELFDIRYFAQQLVKMETCDIMKRGKYD